MPSGVIKARYACSAASSCADVGYLSSLSLHTLYLIQTLQNPFSCWLLSLGCTFCCLLCWSVMCCVLRGYPSEGSSISVCICHVGLWCSAACISLRQQMFFSSGAGDSPEEACGRLDYAPITGPGVEDAARHACFASALKRYALEAALLSYDMYQLSLQHVHLSLQRWGFVVDYVCGVSMKLALLLRVHKYWCWCFWLSTARRLQHANLLLKFEI